VVGIVVVEVAAGIGSERAGSFGDCSGGIGGAVEAIGAGAENRDAARAFESKEGSEDEFLVTASESFAADGDGGFAAGEEADAFAAPGVGLLGEYFAGDGSVHARDVARFAIDGSRKNDGAIAKAFGFRARGFDGLAVTADNDVAHAPEERIARFGRFGKRSRRERDGVTFQNAAGIVASGGIGNGGAGADGAEIVANNVGENQRDHRGGVSQTREMAAFDGRKMLANGVEIVNGCAARLQQFRDALLDCERDAGSGESHQGRCTSGDDAEQEIARAARGGEAGDGTSGGHTAPIGIGVRGVMHGNFRKVRCDAIGDADGAAGEAIAEEILKSEGHGDGGLPCPGDPDAVEPGKAVGLAGYRERVAAEADVRTHGAEGIGGVESGAENGKSGAAGWHLIYAASLRIVQCGV